MDKCDDDYCTTGATYWALTQMCGQDQMWKVTPQPGQVMFARPTGGCYCTCAANVHYCYSPLCTDTTQLQRVITTCAQQHVGYQQFVSVPGNDGSGSATCSCPCPYPMCTVCDDPVVKEYVAEVCRDPYWWPGYPVVMGVQGTPCTCLCPDEKARSMTVAVPAAAGEAAAVRSLHETGEGEQVLAAGTELDWRPAPVVSRTTVHRLTPITAIKVRTDAGGATLAPDQLLLTASRRLKPAIALDPGDRLATPDGGEQTVEEVRQLPMYSLPLPFLALAVDPPDASLSGRLLAVNGFVLGDWSLQVHALLGGLPDGLLTLEPAR